MGSALIVRAALLVGAAAMLMAGPAHAASNVACVLAGKVLQVQPQPLFEHMVRVQLQAVNDDNTLRNEVECSKQFRTGDSLWFSQGVRQGRAAAKRQPVKAGDRIWLSFRYGEDRNGNSWRKYDAITAQDYQERKNGIQ